MSVRQRLADLATRKEDLVMSRIALTIIVASTLLGASVVHAKQTPEQKCQKGRYEAAAKYAACQQKALGAFYGGGKREKFVAAIGKCTVKYAATWPKLQKKASGMGATCDQARFEDNGDGTVTDWLTGLQWEKKDSLDDVQNTGNSHDADNEYSWSLIGSRADGTAFTSFLATLNGGGCFAGQCDWRLPTLVELQTILLEPYPCGTSPCIDPVFGPTVPGVYWSATTSATGLDVAWNMIFDDGTVLNGFKFSALLVRAVRGGL
jgi:hypothetical protein